MEELIISAGSKEEQYQLLVKQIAALITGETDGIANMANIAAALKEQFGFWWVGFYIVKEKQLVLGPFQGPIACTRIHYGKGVCGTAWQRKETIIVADVEQFPGHIACSAQSRSEIVIPVFNKDTCTAVLDIDSEHVATFDEVDKRYLEELVKLL